MIVTLKVTQKLFNSFHFSTEKLIWSREASTAVTLCRIQYKGLFLVALVLFSMASVFSVGGSSNCGKIAFASTRDGKSSIYVMDSDGNNVQRLTDSTVYDGSPAWSPDGKKIVFTSQRDGNNEIYVMDSDGSNVQRLTDNPTWDGFPSWSPDGKKIVFATDRDGDKEIYVMDSDGGNQTNITRNPENDAEPAWSPDGKKIAFSSHRGDNWQVFVMDSDGGNQTNITRNPDYDGSPAWSPDGTKIVLSQAEIVREQRFMSWMLTAAMFRGSPMTLHMISTLPGPLMG